MHIGPHAIEPRVVLAPMAGVTDKPFRMLCKQLGAGLCVSEMTSSDPRLWKTAKSLHRMDHAGEPDPISVQIAGTVPEVMAEAARHNVENGAQVIDINMGCPARKVCNAWAGSALMRDDALVARHADTVVEADTLHTLADDALHALCQSLQPATWVITLGGHGAFVSHAPGKHRGDPGPAYRVPAHPAKPVDTTGAGDAFSGSLAAALAAAPGAPFRESVGFASRYAARSTERHGAALAMPLGEDLEA